MMTLLFMILFFGIIGKLIGFAFKASWSIMKVMLYIVFLPVVFLLNLLIDVLFLGLLIEVFLL